MAIDGRNFRLKGEFNSEIWAETDDDKAIKKGLGPIEDGALKVTGKTREGIAQAPKPKAVWKSSAPLWTSTTGRVLHFCADSRWLQHPWL